MKVHLISFVSRGHLVAPAQLSLVSRPQINPTLDIRALTGSRQKQKESRLTVLCPNSVTMPFTRQQERYPL